MHARLVQSTRAATRAAAGAARLRAFVAAPLPVASPFPSTSRLFRSTAFVREEPKQSPAPIDQQTATELPTEEIPAVSSSLDATKPAEPQAATEQSAEETVAASSSGDAPQAPAAAESAESAETVAATEDAPEQAAEQVDPEAARLAEEAEKDKIARTVFVGGLSWNVDNEWLEDELLKALDATDGVNSVRVARDVRGRSKGFAFVELSTVEFAQQLVGAQAPVIDGRQTQMQASTASARAPRPPRTQSHTGGAQNGHRRNPPNNTIWIGNLPWSADELAVEGAFGRYGPVRRVKLPKDVETGRSRGVAFVEFETLDAANRALRAADERGIRIDSRTVRVDYATAPQTAKPGRRERSQGGRF
ncbi:hypothetical protein JCM3770_007394 [Rhodotorula araucariae]